MYDILIIHAHTNTQVYIFECYVMYVELCSGKSYLIYVVIAPRLLASIVLVGLRRQKKFQLGNAGYTYFVRNCLYETQVSDCQKLRISSTGEI